MKSIAECYGPGLFGLSFELFPPKTEARLAALLRSTQRLAGFNPSYMTCTYGAGGSTQDRTLEVIGNVRQELPDLPVATHLTCVGRTSEEIRSYLDRAADLGVRNVVALRGDPPKGESEFRAVKGGFRYANELVEAIREWFPSWGIAVAGYPEMHMEAPGPEADLENLKRKVDAGADLIITQLFYNNQHFFQFRERCDRIGIRVPIVPGLLPMTNLAQINRIASMCGAELPVEFKEGLHRLAEDEESQFELGVEFATRQTVELIEAGVPGVHFYVLNKSHAAQRVLGEVTLPGPTHPE